MCAYVQLSCVYLMSPLDLTRDKIYQILPLLSGESLGMRLRVQILHKIVIVALRT